jgi:hypothetical protein
LPSLTCSPRFRFAVFGRLAITYVISAVAVEAACHSQCPQTLPRATLSSRALCYCRPSRRFAMHSRVRLESLVPAVVLRSPVAGGHRCRRAQSRAAQSKSASSLQSMASRQFPERAWGLRQLSSLLGEGGAVSPTNRQSSGRLVHKGLRLRLREALALQSRQLPRLFQPSNPQASLSLAAWLDAAVIKASSQAFRDSACSPGCLRSCCFRQTT